MNSVLKTVIAVICVISPLILEAAKKSMTESYAFQRAMEAIDQEKDAEAVEWLNKELGDNPENGYAWYCLAYLNYKYQENGKALQTLNKSIKFLPKKDKDYMSMAYSLRGDTYLELGDTVKAINDYTQAIKIQPEKGDTYKDRAQIYYEQGKYDLADADYRRMIAIDEADVVAHMGLGRNEVARKNYDNAIDIFSHVIKLDSGYSSGYSFRAEAYLGLEKWNEAIDDIIQALNIDANEKARYLARERIDDKHFPILKARYKVLISKEPNQMKWPYLLAEALYSQGDYAQAAEYYIEANRLESWAKSLDNAALCYHEIGDYQNALKYIEKAIQMEPDNYSYLMRKGNILFDMGYYQEAIKELDKYIEHYPDYDFGYYRRGWFKKESGDLEGAIEDLTMAIVLDPNYPYAYLSRGIIYHKKGMEDMAKEDFEKTIELDTIPYGGYSCAHYAYFYLGEKEKAVDFMNKLLDSDEDRAGNYYDAVCLYSLMDEKEKALGYLKEALEKGYRGFAHLKTDEDLDNIRNLPEFNQLIELYSQKITEDSSQEDAPGQKEVRDENPRSKDNILEDEAFIVEGAEEFIPNQPDNKFSRVPFTKEGGVTKVKCSINDLPMYFVFDTGASDVTMSFVEANFMLKNNYIKPTDVVGSQRYMDANGDVSEGTVVILRKVDFGGLELENVRASIVRNQKAPLLLGQSVLGRLGKVEIDNVNQVINITR